ncbi:Peptidoglycan-binding lysin domain protein [Solidesulfovibrio fructosivorans JJ]]|uniref:Peptidoglycan-binding lysin domain protein n=1 Tax=Solidesulfovibrio fructosivorans JJ] TaxID=596151 RepID=E1JW67_SOLFR|nr:DUF459 domain-containing protein [Solidesulfovibrio fructosivorans]EFL51427.1 Peptidoglycan-binding lysin domain protein [Solidesulfovibrio fructosivorans JJ]]
MRPIRRLPTSHDLRTKAPNAGLARARHVGTERVLPLLLACALCLTAVSCKGESGETTQPDGQLTPSDLFSRRAPKPPHAKPLRVLAVGDSLSISLGEQMEHALAGATGIDFTRDGTRSTGLTRPELLDWPARLRERVAGDDPPDVVVIMIGANDVMPVDGPDGSRVFFDNPDWPKAYAAKAREMVAICRAANPNVRVYWVGVPAMGETELAKGVGQVNTALAAMCAAAPGCRFIDTQAAFSDPDGHYSRHGRDGATGEHLTLRTADGVHMTESGAKLLGGVVLAGIAKREHLPPIAGVDELRAYARDVHPIPDQIVAAPQETKPPKSKARPSGKVYTVKKGDTIRVIARRMGISADDLMAINPNVEATRLSLGQALRLPVKHRQ